MEKSIPIDEVANCSCLRIRKATRRITQIYDQLLEPSGITTTQFGLLAHLMPLKRISIGKLADLLVMDPTTLTRTLHPLVARNYLKFAPARHHPRPRPIFLTARRAAA